MELLKGWLVRLTNHPVWGKSLGVMLFFVIFWIGLKILLRGPMGILDWRYLLMLLGLGLGMHVGILDRFIFAYLTSPLDEFSQQIKNLVREWRLWEVIKLAHNHNLEGRRLSTNNILFAGVWVFLALFVLTSSVSFFSRGLIMGVGLVLVRDVVIDLSNLEHLKQRLFWPIARKLADDETKLVAYMLIGAFFFLTLLSTA